MTAVEMGEMERLLSALCDGEIDGAQKSRLEALLESSGECRRVYLEYMDLHGALLIRGQRGAMFAGAPTHDLVCTPALPSTLAKTSAPMREANSTLRLYQGFLIALFTLVVSILVQVWWWQPGRTPAPAAARSKDDVAPPAAKDAPTIATLKQAIDCDWGGAAKPLQVGARLTAGQFSLAKGIAYVQFDSGSELVVQGPAALRFDSGTAVTVLSGKVVFRGDESAAPFDLATPNSVFEESASEFAVDVTSDSEEVHVFEGDVERKPNATASKAAPEHLKAGEARAYGPKSMQNGRPTKCDPSGFVRRLAPVRATPDPTTGLCAYEGFDYRNPGSLALGKANGGIGWLGSWKMGFTRSSAEGDRPRSPFSMRANLTRPDQPTPSIGGSFDYTGYTKVSRRLVRPVRLDADLNYYVSFLFQRTGAATDGPGTIAVMLWTNDDFQTQRFEDSRQRLFIGIKGASQLATRLQTMDAKTPLALNPGATYLLVAKIAASRAGAKRIFAQVYGPEDPIESAEPSKWSLASPPFQSDLTFDWLQLHINGKTRQTLDELRLGTTWASVALPFVAATH